MGTLGKGDGTPLKDRVPGTYTHRQRPSTDPQLYTGNLGHWAQV